MTSSARTDQARVTVVVSHLSPTLGMERAGLRVIAALETRFAVRVVSLAGGADDHALHPSVRTASSRQLRGWGRLLTVVRARRLLADDDAAVRIFVGAPAALVGLLVTRPGSRDVAWEHSLSADRIDGSPALGAVWSLLRRRYAKVGTVVAVSPVVSRLVTTSGCPDVRMVPNMLDDEREEITRDAERPAAPTATDQVELLTVGTLSRLKNQEAVITALAELPRHVRLTVVGDGPHRAALEAHAARTGVAARVTFTGRLPGPGVRERMRASTILVHASASETFGLVYFEAAGSRLPVVSTDHTTARWLIPAYVPGTVTPAHGIADGVRRLLAGMPSDAEWEQSAAARRRDFDSTVTARTWIALVEEIASRERSSP